MTKTSTNPTRQAFTDSMFSMWRCVILVAHADGVIHDKERELFDKVFASLARTYALTPEHMATFQQDFAQKQDIDVLLPRVTDPEAKALLLFFAQVVASIDGVLAYNEATLVGQLHARIGNSPDAKDRVAEIRADIADQMKNRRADQGTVDRNPIYYALDALLLRLGVDPID